MQLFFNCFTNQSIIVFVNDVIIGVTGELNILDGLNIIHPNGTILGNWVFENFILADESVANALRTFENCVSINKNLCGKLMSSLEFPIKFDERLEDWKFRTIFISYFDFLTCQLPKFTFNVLC